MLDLFRGRVALCLFLSCFVLTTVVEIAAIFAGDDQWKRIALIIPYILPSSYTLLGIAVGYYFGHEKKN